jgi:hypothetical protein
MGNQNQAFAMLLIAFCLIPIVALQSYNAKAQNTSQDLAPAIQWQHEYGQWNVQHSSNLVQTNDNGFVFMDTGSHYQVTLKPATIYKLDSSGNTQWTKTINPLIGDVIIQTSDGGYEITGEWSTGQGTVYTPTLIKTDSQGNIQWVQNYSRVPSLGIAGSMQFWEGYNATYKNTIQTSDGGFVYWSLAQITKTDSTNKTQWVENFNYTRYSRLPIYWLIETSDGAIAFLGVGLLYEDNLRSGNIYLYKTEPFLPPITPVVLPTAIPTVSEFPAALAILFVFMSALAVLVSFRRMKT